MAGQLKAIMHVQKQHTATKRERGAEMPGPESKRPAPFKPLRKAPISVKATQQQGSEGEESDLHKYADDDDSVLSRSSRLLLQGSAQEIATELEISRR
jgi:hypothetical protein